MHAEKMQPAIIDDWYVYNLKVMSVFVRLIYVKYEKVTNAPPGRNVQDEDCNRGNNGTCNE